jgi:hypothetical protein
LSDIKMSNTPVENTPPKLLEQVVARIRVKHYSRRTEQAYVAWIKHYILFDGKRHPKASRECKMTLFPHQ